MKNFSESWQSGCGLCFQHEYKAVAVLPNPALFLGRDFAKDIYIFMTAGTSSSLKMNFYFKFNCWLTATLIKYSI